LEGELVGFLDNIPITSTAGFIGLGLLVLGGFMVLAGLDIIRIERITVRQGRTTWIVGVVFAIIGIALLYPELIPSKAASETDTSSALAPTTVPAATAAPVSAPESAAVGSDWTSVAFRIPSGNLWRQADGSYTAVGSKDTMAWSEEVYEGDLELSVDVESPGAGGGPTVLVYGDGQGFSPGVLIFAVANDYQWIAADTVYDEARFLAVAELGMSSDDQAHTLGIRVADGRATLSWDGREIVSAFLGDDINSTGRIGLYKYWERPEMTFSNVRVRVPKQGDQ
jgi:hypothetical protein